MTNAIFTELPISQMASINPLPSGYHYKKQPGQFQLPGILTHSTASCFTYKKTATEIEFRLAKAALPKYRTKRKQIKIHNFPKFSSA